MGWPLSASSSMTVCLRPADREDGESKLWETLGQRHTVWEGQYSPLSTAETATSGTGESHVPAGVVAVPLVGARSQKHIGWCREVGEQPSSADMDGCNGDDAFLSPGDGGQMLAHNLPGLAVMAAVGSEWREREKSVNIYLKNAHPVQCVWESVFGTEEGEKIIKNF